MLNEQTPSFDWFDWFHTPSSSQSNHMSNCCIPIKYTGNRKKLNDFSKFIFSQKLLSTEPRSADFLAKD